MKRGLLFHSNAVWPPLGLVALFAFIYGMLEAGLWIIEHPWRNVGLELEATPEIRATRTLLLGAAAVLYALYRLWRFHPAWNLAYAAWLRLSPWTPDKPLPLGPVHLVWQDAVVIGALAALARWHAQADPTIPLILFGAVYLAGMTFLLLLTRTWVPCLLLGFLWSAPIIPALRGPPTLGIIAGLIVVTWYGYRKSLRAFPWRRGEANGPASIRTSRPKSPLELEIRIDGLSNSPAARTPSLGWPFLWISPKAVHSSVATSTSLSLSALFAWWTYCLMAGLEAPPDCAPMLFVFALIAALSRLAIYCSGLRPPFNIWGRLASGRIIVPGFDQVFVTPLIVVVVGSIGGAAVRVSEPWHQASAAGVMALLWFLLLNGGPSLRRWILTGQHRYHSPARLGTNRQLLKPI